MLNSQNNFQYAFTSSKFSFYRYKWLFKYTFSKQSYWKNACAKYPYIIILIRGGKIITQKLSFDKVLYWVWTNKRGEKEVKGHIKVRGLQQTYLALEISQDLSYHVSKLIRSKDEDKFGGIMWLVKWCFQDTINEAKTELIVFNVACTSSLQKITYG